MTQAGQGQSMEASITINNIDKVGPTITSVTFKKADNTAYTVGTWSNQNVIQTTVASDGNGSGVSSYQLTLNRC